MVSPHEGEAEIQRERAGDREFDRTEDRGYEERRPPGDERGGIRVLRDAHDGGVAVVADKPADDAHVDDVRAHDGDPAVAEYDALHEEHQRQDEDSRVRRPEDDRRERRPDHVAACSPGDGDVQRLDGKDSCRKHGDQRHLLFHH